MFAHNQRLGIDLPVFDTPFEAMSLDDQEALLVRWEAIRARIPERIMHFEDVIEDLLQQVHQEEDWDTIAAFFGQISDYASRINELNTWRRVDQGLQPHDHDSLANEHTSREK